VANPADGTVSAYALNSATGALTALPGSPFTVGPSPKSLSVDNSGRYLYVASSTGNNVAAFAIDSATGILTAVPGSPFPAGSTPVSIAASGIIH
jgi:6-phosphogluconolactonase